jgi:uncharacterized protein
MIVEGREVLLSASDLMRFMSCQHATALDLCYAKGELLEPTEDAEDVKLLQKQGDEHESRYLSVLKGKGRSVVELTRDRGLAPAAQVTRAALASGPDVIFQGAFFASPWGGYADFLERVDRSSKLGEFSYEVVDTKLKRKPDPKHVLQLVLYSDLLAEVQGCVPEQAHIELGSGERYSFRLQDYSAYARHARKRLERFVQAPPTTSPDPVRMCGLCRWREVCQSHWERTDSLSLVAGISRSQRNKLLAAGIDTMAKLGQRIQRVPRLAEATQQRLATQARLQSARRAGGAPSFVLKPIVAERGLTLLPEPNAGDVFYDIEGDPFFDGGLEYLHGTWFQDKGIGIFRDYWAHSRAEEGEALRRLMSFFADRMRQFPRAHVYHYAAYEISALRRLSSTHGIGEALLDQMLRESRFVDLYSVVSGALITSEPNYSLKSLEAFYMEERTGDVKSAGGSVVAYENWRETGDQRLLDEIKDYNRVDCVSTQQLRDWLVSSIRPADLPWRPVGGKNGAGDFNLGAVNKEQEAADALREKLKAVAGHYGERVAALLYDLSHFHNRERKPSWWSIFDKIEKEVDELIEDADCLGGLTARSPAVKIGRSWERAYDFPEQETKIRPGACHTELNGLPAPVSLVEFDPMRRVARVKFPTARFDVVPDRLSLLPGPPLGTDAIEAAIFRVVDSMIRGVRRYPAIVEFLLRSKPRFSTPGRQNAIANPTRPIVSEAVSAIESLDRSVLPIQGPPGTGKTYVSACAILELVKKGKRVAVASNSHKAIDNLLYAVLDRASESGEQISVAKKGGEEVDEAYSDRIYLTERNEDAELLQASVVGGTAWLFAREDFDASFDYLFVDEAGQVSLANMVGMATCARNVVLVGDPMQLAQPVQGAHPGESGYSALEYLLAGHNTVPADQGIFLPISRRMHPNLCRYVSNIVYDGRLSSDEGAARQRFLDDSPMYRAGVGLVEVAHSGNSQAASEEVRAIRDEVSRLVGKVFRDRDGKERPLRLGDILVVAPYNLQVNALKAGLPAAVRIGTVDKFQGQEAPVCLVSMTASSVDEIPHGLDFLFSLNRINVAVSRAQILAKVFASPRLLEIPCTDVAAMRLVNSLCAIQQYQNEEGSNGHPCADTLSDQSGHVMSFQSEVLSNRNV